MDIIQGHGPTFEFPDVTAFLHQVAPSPTTGAATAPTRTHKATVPFNMATRTSAYAGALRGYKEETAVREAHNTFNLGHINFQKLCT